MCIKVSYVRPTSAVWVIMRQTPVGVEEIPMQELSTFTIQDNEHALPAGRRYFAALDPTAGWTSCLIQVHTEPVTDVKIITIYAVQNWNPEIKADPATKITRGSLPFYAALYGDAFIDTLAECSFDSFSFYRDVLRVTEDGRIDIDKKRWYSERDADNNYRIYEDEQYGDNYTNESGALQMVMSYKIGEFYASKIAKDSVDIESTLAKDDSVSTATIVDVLKDVWYFEWVTVVVKEKHIDVHTLSHICIEVIQQHASLTYTRDAQPEQDAIQRTLF